MRWPTEVRLITRVWKVGVEELSKRGRSVWTRRKCARWLTANWSSKPSFERVNGEAMTPDRWSAFAIFLSSPTSLTCVVHDYVQSIGPDLYAMRSHSNAFQAIHVHLNHFNFLPSVCDKLLWITLSYLIDDLPSLCNVANHNEKLCACCIQSTHGFNSNTGTTTRYENHFIGEALRCFCVIAYDLHRCRAHIAGTFRTGMLFFIW